MVRSIIIQFMLALLLLGSFWLLMEMSYGRLAIQSHSDTLSHSDTHNYISDNRESSEEFHNNHDYTEEFCNPLLQNLGLIDGIGDSHCIGGIGGIGGISGIGGKRRFRL